MILRKSLNCRKKVQAAITIAVFFVASLASHGQTVYVPSSHWVYNFLDRMDAKNYLAFPLLNTKPLTRTEIVTILSSLEKNHDLLDKVEKEQFEFLKFEFMEEFQRLYKNSSSYQSRLFKLIRLSWIDPWVPNKIYSNQRNFFSYSNKSLKLYWDPLFLRRRLYAEADTLNGTERLFEDSNGFVLWGTIGQNLGFLTNVRDTKEWGTRKYLNSRNSSREGWGFVQESGDHLYHDETIAYLVYQWRYLTIQFGKDKNRWGAGHFGQLALSDKATSYDQIKWQLKWPRIKFTSIIGFLKHYNSDFFYGNPQEKMLAAHRLEFVPAKMLTIGLHETIIYGNRKFEPGYINPVMFYRSAEHYLGDQDNAAMGIDAVAKIFPKTKIYAELFIDDVQTKKIGTGFYGNKYAWQVGGYRVDTFGVPQLDFRLEYTRVRPFTYTHKFDLTSYRHFTTNLGHPIGPNAESLIGELSYRLTWRLQFRILAEKRVHGANTKEANVGGSIFRPHSSSEDPINIEFLDGVREETRTLGFFINYELIRNGIIEIAFYKYRGSSELSCAGSNYPGKRTVAAITLSLNY